MPAKILSRKETKELTRKRLVDGTLEILRKEGVGAATTGRIAHAAGIKQSSFYGHFSDRDECLRAAADQIGGYVLHRLQKQRVAFTMINVEDSIRSLINTVMDAFLSAPELTRIFLRYRTDDESPLGVRFRAFVDAARDQLRDDFRRYGVVADADLAAAYAEFFVAGTLACIEGSLEGRIVSRRQAIDGIVAIACAAIGRKDERS